MKSGSCVIFNGQDCERSDTPYLGDISPIRKRLLIRTPEKCNDDFDNGYQKIKPIRSRMAVEILRTNRLCLQFVEDEPPISKTAGNGNTHELENYQVNQGKQEKSNENNKPDLATANEYATENLTKAIAICAVCPNEPPTCQSCVKTTPTSAPLKKTVRCYDNYHQHEDDVSKQEPLCGCQKLLDETTKFHLGANYSGIITDYPITVRYIAVRSDAIIIKRQFRKLKWGEKLMRKLRHM
ncbi:unnamed protein product [Rodentolepis nana]|uniref:Uncharacterized protein n=1 Tax=Rodentolepis nana TaxID=102285 RepID=A0A0R3T283_RODNA|nr:unnamed protein product [Rodentolepis nana]